MPGSLVLHTTDGTFDGDVIKSNVPVLLDFTATWCAPCKAIAPILDDMSTVYQGKLRIIKLDVDQNPQTAMRYGVRNIPTLLLLKNGEVVDQRVGGLNRRDLDKFVSKVVEGAA